MTQLPPTDHLEQVIEKAAPGSRLLRAWPLKGGISAEMTVLEIEGQDGQHRRIILRQPGEAALKQNPRAAEDEFKLLQGAHRLGLAAPEPYFLDTTGQIFPAPYLLIQYIEGLPEFAPPHRESFATQLADHLARIHQTNAAGVDFSFLPHPAKGFAETFGNASPSIDPSVDQKRVRETLAATWPIPQRNATTLLHGDYWPGNILWRHGQLVAVIDWEDAQLGDPLADFAISRLDLLWIFGQETMDAFSREYQARMALDTTCLPYWDLYAALRLARLAGEDLAGWAAFFRPFGREDITEDTIRAYYRFFVAQAFNQLED